MTLSAAGAELSAVHSGQIRITLQQAQAQLQNSIRATLLQALGGILVMVGAVATWRQVRISRDGQITDRLTHARTGHLALQNSVELRGFEPLTPSMRTRCATGLRYSPENL